MNANDRCTCRMWALANQDKRVEVLSKTPNYYVARAVEFSFSEGVEDYIVDGIPILSYIKREALLKNLGACHGRHK